MRCNCNNVYTSTQFFFEFRKGQLNTNHVHFLCYKMFSSVAHLVGNNSSELKLFGEEKKK